MIEVKYDRSHPAGATPEARIANRLKNSGSPEADVHAVHGTGPTRAHTNIHSTGHVLQRGDDEKGVGIYGNPRGPANRDGEI
jgi:hypothetical protein